LFGLKLIIKTTDNLKTIRQPISNIIINVFKDNYYSSYDLKNGNDISHFVPSFPSWPWIFDEIGGMSLLRENLGFYLFMRRFYSG